MLYSKRTKDTYENFEAECPHCGHWNVFNRVSDLDGESQISFRRVTCLGPGCGGEFAINGDSADAPYAKVFIDGYRMMAAKRYGDAVLNIARAYEMFFAHFLREALAWKPFMANRRRLDFDHFYEPDDVNGVVSRLNSVILRWPYQPMRTAFVNVAAMEQPATLEAGDAIITLLPTLSKAIDRMAIDALTNSVLRDTLLRLLRPDTASTRNDIVHKFGHRPSAIEAGEIFEEARVVIWTLADELDVRFESV